MSGTASSSEAPGATGAAPTGGRAPASNGGGNGADNGGVPSSGGSFGLAGTGESGASAEAPAAGEAAGGGLGTEPGGTEAGQGGAAGQLATPPKTQACFQCGAQACAGVLDSCANNPECAGWLDCVNGCDSDACTNACDASFSRVSRVYYGVYSCLCGSCEADCKVFSVCSKRCTDEAALAPTAVAPDTLAETGLYATVTDSTALPAIAAGVEPYFPNYALWADGAGKDRYVYIPACATIDTRDPDHWDFPVGTRLWKHFSLSDTLIETRMIHRYGVGAADWLFVSYGWDPSKPRDPRAAVAVLHGQPNAGGTIHDIPDPWECTACHGKLPDKPLGFGAIQLSHDGAGLTMQKLSDWGWLTVPARNGFAIAGTPTQRAALGYLHANCGGCHNSYGQLPRDNPLLLRSLVAQTDYAQTDAVTTTVGVPTINAAAELNGKPRIDPQQPSSSAIFLRMSNRTEFPMPPIATKLPDTDGGLALLRAWIETMPKKP